MVLASLYLFYLRKIIWKRGFFIMVNERVSTLAHILVNHSCKVQPGEKVMIDLFGDDKELAIALVQEVYKARGFPFVQLTDQLVHRSLLMGTNGEHLDFWTQIGLDQMKKMDCYIGVRGSENISEYSDVPDDLMSLYSRTYSHAVHTEERVNNTKWVVLRYPSGSMAQLANMSTEGFTKYFFDVCNVDYVKMEKAMRPLVARMEKTDHVHIKGPGTDLQFSIKGIPVISCAGEHNIPDGEVFTAPVKNSVNGTVQYNAPTIYNGFLFDNVKLEFKDGKIINATANNTEKINQIFDTDEGARYIGEFSLGVNPNINHPMRDILFDEKINGSFHFTPGQAYEEADNTNRSAIHWDLVCIQRPEYGGGEVYFDGELIRKDGLFVVDDLKALNPENLK
jgi:aminopeptidase